MNDNLRNNTDIISEIVKLQTRIGEAIFKGHKASDDDEFTLDRKRLVILRQIMIDRNCTHFKKI